jgi:hypothetical protein
MAVLSVLLICGALLDGWAHTHGEVDQSFLTPWHAVLYASLALNGLALLFAGVRGLRKGYTFANALPPGYWPAAVGVVLFATGGAFDAWWHTQFGIESGIVLLISPPHLLLAFAALLVMSGPCGSVASQYDRNARGWKIVGPAVLSTWAMLTTVGFFLAYAQPIEDGFTPLTMRAASDGTVYPMLYSADLRGDVTRVAIAPRTDLETVDVAPDGKHIVYRVNRYHAFDALPPSDLYLANSDGSDPRRITSSGRHDTQPAWSPNGKWIAYVSMPAESSGDFKIRLISADGRNARDVVSQTTTISELSWSPDSSAIAYGSRNATTAMIGVVDVATGNTHWLPFTANAGTPIWSHAELIYARNDDGSIRETSIDGDRTRTLVPHSEGSPALSRDGRYLAYVSRDLGSAQLYVARADGSHARDLSQLSGVDVQDAVWTPDAHVLFVATGRPETAYTAAGQSLAIAALLLQAVLVTGAVLLLIHRWNAPPGALTLTLTCFALAMALQSDFFSYAIGAFATGLIADVAVATFKDRLRTGLGLHVAGFLVPFLFTAFFELVTADTLGATGWTLNLRLGVPLLAGAAGLFLAFCFDSPFAHRATTPSP